MAQPVTTTDAKSEAIRGALLAIAKANRGVLTPEHVVKAARNPKNILHDYFEWDADSAHEQYLLVQASVLIRRVKFHVIREQSEDKTISFDVVREFHSRPSMRHKEGGYEAVEDIMMADSKRMELLETALRELEAFERKYAQLQELAVVFQAIKKTIKSKAKTTA